MGLKPEKASKTFDATGIRPRQHRTGLAGFEATKSNRTDLAEALL